jgi:hypothetical protein
MANTPSKILGFVTTKNNLFEKFYKLIFFAQHLPSHSCERDRVFQQVYENHGEGGCLVRKVAKIRLRNDPWEAHIGWIIRQENIFHHTRAAGIRVI